MQLTREADYAIRTMLELASRPPGAVVTTADVARRRLVPRPFLRQIVPGLVAAGLLRSRRGAGGGLSLARPADEVSILSIIDAAEGPIAVNRCVLRPDVCALQPTCPMHEVCRVARAQLVHLLSGISLADLARRGQELMAAASAARYPARQETDECET